MALTRIFRPFVDPDLSTFDIVHIQRRKVLNRISQREHHKLSRLVTFVSSEIQQESNHFLAKDLHDFHIDIPLAHPE